MRRFLVRGLTLALISGGAATAHTVPQAARGDRFTAIALPPTADGHPTPIDIVVERWSTDAEADGVMTALTELGTKGMLKALQKLPRVGSFATTGATGYPIRYARSV